MCVEKKKGEQNWYVDTQHIPIPATDSRFQHVKGRFRTWEGDVQDVVHFLDERLCEAKSQLKNR